MIICLVDCDWEEGVSLTPNPWLMKASSAFKQAGHSVYLVDSDSRRLKDADRVFISKDKDTDFYPNPSLLVSKKTRLIGEGFKFHNNDWNIPKSVIQARPDYLLYKIDRNDEFQNSNFISKIFKGEIVQTQEQIRTSYLKVDTIVIDYGIWELETSVLKEYLTSLQGIERLKFREPIDFNILKNSEILELFSKLHVFRDRIKHKIIYSVEEFRKVANSRKIIANNSNLSIDQIRVSIYGGKKPKYERLLELIELCAASLDLNTDIVFVKDYYLYNGFDFLLTYRRRYGTILNYWCRKETKINADLALTMINMQGHTSVAAILELYKYNRKHFELGFEISKGVKSNIRKRINDKELDRL